MPFHLLGKRVTGAAFQKILNYFTLSYAINLSRIILLSYFIVVSEKFKLKFISTKCLLPMISRNELSITQSTLRSYEHYLLYGHMNTIYSTVRRTLSTLRSDEHYLLYGQMDTIYSTVRRTISTLRLDGHYLLNG